MDPARLRGTTTRCEQRTSTRPGRLQRCPQRGAPGDWPGCWTSCVAPPWNSDAGFGRSGPRLKGSDRPSRDSELGAERRRDERSSSRGVDTDRVTRHSWWMTESSTMSALLQGFAEFGKEKQVRSDRLARVLLTLTPFVLALLAWVLVRWLQGVQ